MVKLGFLVYILTTFIFIIGAILLKPEIKEEDRNEKRKLGGYIFLSTILVQVVSLFFGQLYLYNILVAFASSMLTYIFYKIFSNGIVVIREYKEKAAFSIEEILAASILITVALSAIPELSVFGFSITNILCILMVLILGWKNGILVGVTAGTTIGIILGIIGGQEPILVAAYAISGLMAGILNRLGKIGAIIGFGIGNLLFAYIVNGATAEIIHLKEIIVASIALLVVPRSLEINITDLIGNTKLLSSSKNRMIENTESTVFKLNNMSETITELADTYKEVAATTVETVVEAEKENRNIFIDTVFSNIEVLSENILYEDMINLETGILDEIFEILNKKEEIEFLDIVEVFEKRNSYILSTDDKEVKRNVEKDIWRMVKTINNSYMLSKVNFIWMQKSQENQKNISNQLEGISEVISSVAEELSEKADEKVSNKKSEIQTIFKQREIEYIDIAVKRQKNKKYSISLFIEKCDDISEELVRINRIEEILTKVLEQEINLQKQKDIGDRKLITYI